MNLTVAVIIGALTVAILAVMVALVLAVVVRRQHGTIDRQDYINEALSDDAVKLSRLHEWQAAEILRLRALQPTQVMQVTPPAPPTSPRYDRSAT